MARSKSVESPAFRRQPRWTWCLSKMKRACGRRSDREPRRSSRVSLPGFGCEGKECRKPLLICRHPRLAFARAARLLCPAPERQPGTHPTAVVHASARLGRERDRGRASRHRREGRDRRSDLDWRRRCNRCGRSYRQRLRDISQCHHLPGCTTRRSGDRPCRSGAGRDGFGYVRDPASGHYEKFPQVGRLEIGDDVEIGANSTIDRGALEVTRIGRGAKIEIWCTSATTARSGKTW